MSVRACLCSMAVLSLFSPAAYAAKKATPTPAPAATATEVEDTPIDLDAPLPDSAIPDDEPGISDVPSAMSPKASATQVLGADYVDKELKFTVPSPGAEWVRISPVSAPGVRGAFVHTRADRVLGLVAVTAETGPQTKDFTAFVKNSAGSLTSAPLSFTIEKRAPVKVAGRDGYVVDFLSSTKLRKYEQLYVPLKMGGVVVLTFQAPTRIFDAEIADFRRAAKNFSP